MSPDADGVREPRDATIATACGPRSRSASPCRASASRSGSWHALRGWAPSPRSSCRPPRSPALRSSRRSPSWRRAEVSRRRPWPPCSSTQGTHPSGSASPRTSPAPGGPDSSTASSSSTSPGRSRPKVTVGSTHGSCSARASNTDRQQAETRILFAAEAACAAPGHHRPPSWWPACPGTPGSSASSPRGW